MAEAGGVNIVVDSDTMQAVAQRLVCWDKEGGAAAQAVVYRTDGNLPYFHIPSGACAGRTDLTLIPGGTVIACPETGNPTLVQPAPGEVSGLNANTCQEIPAPTGLAVQGTPTTSSITMGWNGPDSGPAPSGYRLSYRAGGGNGTWSHLEVAAGQTQGTVSGLTANTGYVFRVAARHGTFLSAPSAEVSVSTAAEPEPPENP